MGYIAFTIGSTLIAAVAIHTLYNRHVSAKIKSAALGTSEKADHPARIEKEQAAEAPALHVSPPTVEVKDEDEDKAIETTQNERPETPLSLPRPVSTSTPPSAVAQSRQHASMAPPSLPRSRNHSPPRLKPATSSLAPRPTPPRQGGFLAPQGYSNGNIPTPRTPTSLSVPQQRTLANTKMQPALAPSTSTQPPSKRPSRKVMLSPGHSPLDWAALTKSTSASSVSQLRGPDAMSALGPVRLGKVTPSQLKMQTGRKGKDAWTSYQGKVYNISAYLDFHPGGQDELMKGAGRSSDSLFAEVHPWVNWDGMLLNCLVGMLVSEGDPGAIGRLESGGADVENVLDEMD